MADAARYVLVGTVILLGLAALFLGTAYGVATMGPPL